MANFGKDSKYTLGIGSQNVLVVRKNDRVMTAGAIVDELQKMEKALAAGRRRPTKERERDLDYA